jgi:methylenetetrahydrofolate reductase (NADPH)
MARAALGRRPAALAGLLRSARYEVIPTKTIEESILAVVPKDVGVTVTASPAKGIEATVELAERLAGHGYRVVPHLSARLLRDKAHLADLVQRLRAVGVDDVFMPAGDADPPAGEYQAALPALADLTALGSPFPKVGITGYPESHPAIDDDVTVQAMWDKRAHATYIVSNLCFDAATIAEWVKRVRRRGIVLPILLGLAGPVERTKLLSMATKVGVGQSTRFLTQHASWFARLAAPGYAPERLLTRVAREVGAPEYGLAGLHVFTFNQVTETEQWRQELLASAS